MTTIATYLTSVAEVADVHPRLRRITLAGGDLEEFAPLGPDTFVYVLLPPMGHETLTIDRAFTWDAWAEMPEPQRPRGAYYSVHRWRPADHAMELSFVLHEPAGPASAWAATARVGDPVAVWGPREAFTPPSDASTFFLVADDTGLPALGAILESLDTDQQAIVVAEVADHRHRPPLPDRAGIELHWVYRNGRPAGTATGDVLDVVRRAAPRSERAYAWGGGESRTMTAVRSHLRRERRWPRESVSMTAYWRRTDVALPVPNGAR